MWLTFRYFIDFFRQATAKEHSESTLYEMERSLKKYYKHSAIMEQFSDVGSLLLLSSFAEELMELFNVVRVECAFQKTIFF